MRFGMIVAIALSIGTAAYAGPFTLTGSIAAVEQLDTNATDPSGSNIQTLEGEFAINANAGSGYLNVLDASGNWVVQNLLLGVSGMSGQITDRMSLLAGTTNLSSENLTADLSATPLTSFNTSIASSLSDTVSTLGVTEMTLAIGGTVTNSTLTDSEDGISLNPAGNVAFGGGANSITFQTGHQNVEAAVNQCAPAAVANSLTYLGVNPLGNNPGSFGSPQIPYANSLVAALDVAMGRSATGCNGGPCGVWPLLGKLNYIGQNPSLAANLTVNYQDATTGQGLTGNQTNNGVTAVYQGRPTWSYIQSELAAGEDVELDIQWTCGTAINPQTCRHYVEVTGAGTILGQQWITTVSDQLQGQVGGTNTTQFDWVTGNNGLPGWGTGAIIDQVITESTPEPGTIALLGIGLAGLAGFRKYRLG